MDDNERARAAADKKVELDNHRKDVASSQARVEKLEAEIKDLGNKLKVEKAGLASLKETEDHLNTEVRHHTRSLVILILTGYCYSGMSWRCLGSATPRWIEGFLGSSQQHTEWNWLRPLPWPTTVFDQLASGYALALRSPFSL